MDNGEEIPGLNEEWSLLGAKLMEWVSGLIMAMVCSELFGLKTGKTFPFVAIAFLATVFLLASLRRQFPDEERGIRNLVMVFLGFAPPGIPAPAAIESRWSGGPVRQAAPKSYYTELELEHLFDRVDVEAQENGQWS